MPLNHNFQAYSMKKRSAWTKKSMAVHPKYKAAPARKPAQPELMTVPNRQSTRAKKKKERSQEAKHR